MKSENNPILRYHHRPTRGNAIKAKCAECVGCTPGHIEPGFRELIRECEGVSCPLWVYRPYQQKVPQ